MTESKQYFIPSNAKLEERKEHVSPSGLYKLVVTPFKTKEGSWNYAQGVIYRQADDARIAIIERNYPVFPFTWIEGHANGHSYLVGGEDYQGQTVVELDTGRRRDALSPGAEQGIGFCWASVRYHAESQMLIVNGCIWAWPYEFRFYDFSDPMAGWAAIEADEEREIDDDADQWPTIDENGVLTCYEAADEGDTDEGPYKSILTFKREGQKLVLQSKWLSDKEKAHRQAVAKDQKAFDEWYETFRATDPLYLVVAQTVKRPPFSPSAYPSVGITHDDWCADFRAKERRFCWRILETKERAVDIEWAVVSGPIKLIVWKGGERVEKFFGHSVDEMRVALKQASDSAG